MKESQSFLCPTLIALGFSGLLAGPVSATASDQPQWGSAWSRNMVSDATNLPDAFDPDDGTNIRWSVALGTESHSSPVVAGGRVIIGTNNGNPRDPKHQGDRGVLMCFDEKDGTLLWQLVAPKREEDKYFDWPKSGVSSPATVEGDRVYVVSNRGEVMCLDLNGMADGNDGPFKDEGRHMTPVGEPTMEPGPLDADIIWLFNLTTGAGIWSHDAAHSSILIHGNHLYLNTGTGVDNTHKRIRTPDAPSLVVVDKRTGAYLARENEGQAPVIFHCTWAAPSLGHVDGNPRVFFAGGDGIVYAYRPINAKSDAGELRFLEKLWSFDFDPAAPKKNVHRYNGNRKVSPSNIYGMPVFDAGRIYVAGGGDLFWGKKQASLKCIDSRGSGDVTKTHQLWTYPLENHTVCTPAVHQGLVYAADTGKMIHCVDAETGRAVWTQEAGGQFWASPMVADGKLFIGSRRGDFWILAAGRGKRVLSQINLDSPISATATAANNTLYVATMNRLHAVGHGIDQEIHGTTKSAVPREKQ